MLARPDTLPVWATTDVVDPITGLPNKISPPQTHIDVGWSFKEPPARNYFNWHMNLGGEWIEHIDYRINTLDKITDGDGTTLFDVDDTFIHLYAFDSTNTSNYLVAFGQKVASTAPTLIVTDSNVLALGAGAADGTQPITGGTAVNIVVRGIMRPMGS